LIIKTNARSKKAETPFEVFKVKDKKICN